MNEEFAIEPTAFRNFDDVRYVLGKFGFHEGRFISALPGKWVKEVYAHLEKFPDGPAKQKAKEIIRIAKVERGGIVSCGVAFNPAMSWLKNVAACGKEFNGILVSEETTIDKQESGCRSIAEIEDSFFGSCREASIFPTVEEFGRVATNLLSISHEVFLIDPYFNFSKSSNIRVLQKFIDIGVARKCKTFVIYTDAKVNKPNGIDSILRTNFNETGALVKVYHVQKSSSEKDFHPRFLLSKFGGIRFDKGFEIEGVKGVKRDIVAIDINKHEDLCKLYLDGEHGLKISAEHLFQG